MLVLKTNVHKPGHYQYAIHYEGKSFSCPRTQKGFTSLDMHFSSFQICSQIFFVSAILHHISLLRLLPKSYFKISTFQPNFCALASLKGLLCCLVAFTGKKSFFLKHCLITNVLGTLNSFLRYLVCPLLFGDSFNPYYLSVDREDHCTCFFILLPL